MMSAREMMNGSEMMDGTEMMDGAAMDGSEMVNGSEMMDGAMMNGIAMDAAGMTMPRGDCLRRTAEGKSSSKDSDQCESTAHDTTLGLRRSSLSNQTATSRDACVVVTSL